MKKKQLNDHIFKLMIIYLVSLRTVRYNILLSIISCSGLFIVDKEEWSYLKNRNSYFHMRLIQLKEAFLKS